MQRPELEIIVPGHNISKFAATLTATVTQADSEGLRWIFVDDGSTDTTREVFVALTNNVGHAQVISLASQGGLAAARNAGIFAATAKFVTFLDADDWVEPGYFAAELAEATQHDVDLIRHGFIEVFGTRHMVRRLDTSRVDIPLDPHDFIMPVTRETLIEKPQAWALVAKREYLLAGNLFNAELLTCEDRDWIWRLMLSADAAVASSTIGYYWRRNVAGSLTQTGGREQLDFLKSYKLTMGYLRSTPAWAQYLPKAYRSYLSILVSQLATAQRLSRDNQLYLCRQAGQLVREIPPELLRLSLFGFGPERREVLRKVASYTPRRLLRELPDIAVE